MSLLYRTNRYFLLNEFSLEQTTFSNKYLGYYKLTSGEESRLERELFSAPVPIPESVSVDWRAAVSAPSAGYKV